MYDRSSIELINQTTRTRRVAFALILLAFIARLWVARHYSAGVQVQVLLAFSLVLIGWSGYVSRLAHEERVSVAAQPVSSTSSRIPGQLEPVDSKSEGAQR